MRGYLKKKRDIKILILLLALFGCSHSPAAVTKQEVILNIQYCFFYRLLQDRFSDLPSQRKLTT